MQRHTVAACSGIQWQRAARNLAACLLLAGLLPRGARRRRDAGARRVPIAAEHSLLAQRLWAVRRRARPDADRTARRRAYHLPRAGPCALIQRRRTCVARVSAPLRPPWPRQRPSAGWGPPRGGPCSHPCPGPARRHSPRGCDAQGMRARCVIHVTPPTTPAASPPCPASGHASSAICHCFLCRRTSRVRVAPHPGATSRFARYGRALVAAAKGWTGVREAHMQRVRDSPRRFGGV